MVKEPALAEVVGPWSEPAVRNRILEHMKDGFKVVFMGKDKRNFNYVEPNDPNYHLRQHQTNVADEQMVTYLVRQ